MIFLILIKNTAAKHIDCLNQIKQNNQELGALNHE